MNCQSTRINIHKYISDLSCVNCVSDLNVFLFFFQKVIAKRNSDITWPWPLNELIRRTKLFQSQNLRGCSGDRTN